MGVTLTSHVSFTVYTEFGVSHARFNCCAREDFPSVLTGIVKLLTTELFGPNTVRETFCTPSASDIVHELITAVSEVTEIAFHVVNVAGESGRSGVLRVNDISSLFHVPAGMTFTCHISFIVYVVLGSNHVRFTCCASEDFPSALTGISPPST